MSKLKVVQVATGTVGTHSLRTIIGRRDMELTGLLVFSSDKVGKDAGEIVGGEPIGVVATDEFEQILALDADVVAYNALGETNDPEAALVQICALLESGKNVCSTAVSVHIYPDIIKSSPLRQRLETACNKGGVTFHSSGINPGYMMDAWPITLSRLTRRIDTIYMTEMVDMSRYTSRQIGDYIGFGKPVEDRIVQFPKEVVLETSFYASLQMFADATGLQFDDATLEWEVAPSPREIHTPVYHVEAGQVGAVQILLRACNDGVVHVENQWVWVLGKDVAPAEWPSGDGAWSVRIVGDPTIETRIEASTAFDAKQPDVLMTAVHAVNAMPAVAASHHLRPGRASGQYLAGPRPTPGNDQMFNPFPNFHSNFII
jgi:2,4-diaminopentanoate dehydrogenase